MIEEYIKKAKIEMQLKFGNKRKAIECLFAAISLLEDEIKQKDLEIERLKKELQQVNDVIKANANLIKGNLNIDISKSLNFQFRLKTD